MLSRIHVTGASGSGTSTLGRALAPGGSHHDEHRGFIEWAKQYDEGGLEMRSRALHEEWLGALSCPVLRLEGTRPVTELVDAVLAKD